MTLFIAHRGSSDAYAEHSRAAYVQAIADAADGLECDVQLTADRELVLWHDTTVDRTSNGSGPVHTFTLAELRALDIVSLRDAEIPQSHGAPEDQVMSLPDLIELAVGADRPLLLAIEFKHPSPFGHDLEDTTFTVLREHGWDRATGLLAGTDVRIRFMSFFPGSLEHAVAKVRGGHLMFLVDEVSDADLVKDFLPGRDPAPEVVEWARHLVQRGMRAVYEGTFAGFGPSVAWCTAHADQVAALAKAGRTVRAWTVNTPDDARLLRGMGVTELTTNRPAQLREELAP